MNQVHQRTFIASRDLVFDMYWCSSICSGLHLKGFILKILQAWIKIVMWSLQGYAAREFVKLGLQPGELTIFSKEAVSD